MNQLRITPSLALLAVAPLIGACADAPAEVIEGGTTVHRNDTEEPDEGPVGKSFAEAGLTDESDGWSTGDPNLTIDQNSELPPYLDPNFAKGLRADPGQKAKGTIEGLVTFGDISLVGVNLDHLLDYIYKPDSEGATMFEFPDKVKEQAGPDRAIIGYMIPLELKPRSDDIISFMLVRDLAACCFGGVPRPDEWIHVEMKEGESTELFRYVPIVVRGHFTVGRLEDEYGYAMGVYNMTADSVERWQPTD